MKLRRRCKCGCGKITSPGCKWVHGHNIRAKNNPKYKHGLRYHKLYTIWKNMKIRCHNQNSSDYWDYGGRGIRVCIRWKDNFVRFYNWAMANGWEEGLQIDRRDNDGNYHPDNCRFVTSKVNANNRRMRKDNTSGYIGVYFYKGNNKYMANPYIDGKLKFLGYFNTAEEAAGAIEEYKCLLKK